ncbi:MAG: DUF4139 domain-containing protein, partial [Gammaproteobacteria bacterium]|nr:DUF4139 domain-containing protein [Gammaproteobacteria bacterium]NNJ84419.1 DUF4139 domain-containing protein [Gammaproteobacteria bacterium]
EKALLKADAARELAAAEKKLDDLKQGARKVSYDVTLDVTTKTGGAVPLLLTYLVRSAGWRPSYHLAGDSGTGKLTIEYFGEVHQRSGEDWRGVEMRFSTGRPALGVTAPEISPWVVDFVRPPPEAAPVLLSRGLRQHAEIAMAPRDTMMAPLVAKATQVVETANSLLYVVPDKQTVPAGADGHRALITQRTFDMALEYFTVPKNSPFVFLGAEITNTGDFHYLPGKSLTYLDGAFVGSGHLDSFAPKETLTLGLGPDRSLRAERRLIKKEGGEQGLFGGKTRLRHVYEIELENLKKKSVVIDVKDQLPLSYHEDIVVAVNRIDPAPKEQDEKNILTWAIELEPKQKKTIRLDFQIEYPEGKRISE